MGLPLGEGLGVTGRRVQRDGYDYTATVDRLLHHAHIVLTEGTSLRLAEATAETGVIPLT
ncbi:MAG: hypothetical protein ACRDS0_05125 [Pseudonocardiaceae bacterium]